MKLAIATDDGINLTKEHFGESKYFLIYETNNKMEFVEKRVNKTPEEITHGSEKKANNISMLLSDVDIFVSNVFGPNINRIRQRFVPVVSKNTTNIKELLPKIENNINKIKESMKSEPKIVVII